MCFVHVFVISSNQVIIVDLLGFEHWCSFSSCCEETRRGAYGHGTSEASLLSQPTQNGPFKVQTLNKHQRKTSNHKSCHVWDNYNVEHILIHRIWLNWYEPIKHHPHTVTQEVGSPDLKSPKTGSVTVLSELQLFGIQTYILCALGLTSAGSTQGLAPLCFHLNKINANLQEKISDKISSEHKTTPNMQGACYMGHVWDEHLALPYLPYHWRSPQESLCIAGAILQVRKTEQKLSTIW